MRIKMIVYEITAKVDAEFIDVYEKYMLEKHINDLIYTNYFTSAEIARISEGNYRVRYLCEDRKTLEKYFQTDAERLRKHFNDTLPEGVSVSREILEIMREF